MRVLGSGFNWHYMESNKVIHQKDEKNYLLYVFYTPTTIKLSDRSYQVDYGNAIVLQSGEPHTISSSTGFFMLDWVEFSLDANDAGMMNYLNIPYNQLLTIKNVNVLSTTIMNCGFMNELEGGDHHQTVTQIFISLLFCIASLMNHSESVRAFQQKYPEIIQLRKDIFEHPQFDWNLDMMCKMTHCSASKLQKLYKQLYSSNCKDDVIVSRVYHAQNLLRSTMLSIGEIAEQSGFNSYEHFSRTFKKQVGCTPNEYRSQK